MLHLSQCVAFEQDWTTAQLGRVTWEIGHKAQQNPYMGLVISSVCEWENLDKVSENMSSLIQVPHSNSQDGPNRLAGLKTAGNSENTRASVLVFGLHAHPHLFA